MSAPAERLMVTAKDLDGRWALMESAIKSAGIAGMDMAHLPTSDWLSDSTLSKSIANSAGSWLMLSNHWLLAARQVLPTLPERASTGVDKVDLGSAFDFIAGRNALLVEKGFAPGGSEVSPNWLENFGAAARDTLQERGEDLAAAMGRTPTGKPAPPSGPFKWLPWAIAAVIIAALAPVVVAMVGARK